MEKWYQVDVRIFETTEHEDGAQSVKMVGQLIYNCFDKDGKLDVTCFRKYVKKTFGMIYDKCIALFQKANKLAKEQRRGGIIKQDFKVSGRDQQKIQEEVR